MTPDDLVEIEAIKRLKYAYLRCLDQKNWAELGTLLVDDATASYGGGAYSFDGKDAILEFISSSMGSESMLSCHRCHHPEIDLTGPDTARGVWALEDTVIEKSFDITIRGAAFYTDDYVKIDGQWRIKHTGYKRTFEEIEPRSSIEGLSLTADWFTTDGRSKLRF